MKIIKKSDSWIISCRFVLTRFKAMWIMAAGLICVMTVNLSSEKLTLTTYYPAPYGVYNKMVTTGKTLLARDGENVGVGLSNPSYKLQISGGDVMAGQSIGSQGWGPGPSLPSWGGGINTWDMEAHGSIWSYWLTSGGPNNTHAADNPNFIVDPLGNINAEDMYIREIDRWVSEISPSFQIITFPYSDCNTYCCPAGMMAIAAGGISNGNKNMHILPVSDRCMWFREGNGCGQSGTGWLTCYKR